MSSNDFYKNNESIDLFRLAERLSQTSAQAIFSNVNPTQSLPYASPLHTQLGKQSAATPRHPKCILHLDGNIYSNNIFEFISFFRLNKKVNFLWVQEQMQ